jgi:hypothetical protein
MPQPVITIDQPQPQIIVRMPEPEVAVNNPAPQVEVRQQQPRVSIEQGQPEVQVVGEGQNPEVQVQQGQPEVVQQVAEGQPQVEVQRAQPQVQFIPAEPKIEVQAAGEPQVRFNQSGEAQVQIEELQGTQETAATQQGASAQQGAAAGAQQQQGGQNNQVLALILNPNQQGEAGQAGPQPANALMGKQVVNWEGQNLGTVERLMAAGDQQYIVLAPDTPLGDGQRGVMLPLTNITMEGEQLILRGMTQQEIDQLGQIDPQSLQPIEQNAEVNVATR